MYDLNSRDIIISRNVVFHESVFSFKKQSTDDTSHITPSNSLALAPSNDSLCYNMPSHVPITFHALAHTDAHVHIGAPMPDSLPTTPTTPINPQQQQSPPNSLESPLELGNHLHICRISIAL